METQKVFSRISFADTHQCYPEASPAMILCPINSSQEPRVVSKHLKSGSEFQASFNYCIGQCKCNQQTSINEEQGFKKNTTMETM